MFVGEYDNGGMNLDLDCFCFGYPSNALFLSLILILSQISFKVFGLYFLFTNEFLVSWGWKVLVVLFKSISCFIEKL